MESPRIEFLLTNVALDRFQRAAEKTLSAEIERLRSSEKTDSKNWLTNNEAQEYLGLSKPTLARYRAEGRLAYSKVGSRIYYRIADLEAMLESHLVTRD